MCHSNQCQIPLYYLIFPAASFLFWITHLFLTMFLSLVLCIILFYYDYSSDTSDTSDINSDLYLSLQLMFPIFKSILQFPLLPLPCYYHLSPYFLITAPRLTLFSPLWLSLINLPLPYHTVLQTTPPHLSVLCYINCSHFIVVLQFVNCSQLPQSKLLNLHTLVTNSG